MKLSILLLFGGESTEHEISLTSARNVLHAIDMTKYDVSLGYITKQGEWLLIDAINQLKSDNILTPVLGQGLFQTSHGQAISVDVIFPVLHGAHGEDGEVQGLARLMHIPCVGPSLVGAAVTMDKDVAKRLLKNAGIPVVEWQVWHRSVSMPPYEDMTAALGATLFVKPANAGSSVGVSKVKVVDDYEKAMNFAAENDSLVIVERAINAREIEVAVAGNGADLTVSTPGEVIVGEEFYSYDDKYSSGSTSRTQIPADLTASVAEKIKEYAATAYIATRGQGMARVDFFIDRDTQDIYLNEINSIPGFTNISMYPKLMEYEGHTYTDLMDWLISLACKV